MVHLETTFGKDGKVIKVAGEGTYGIRCAECNELVQDWSKDGEFCTLHKKRK